MTTRDEIRAAISNAYYEARDNRGTMETAADNAADAVMALIASAEPEEQIGTIHQRPFGHRAVCTVPRCGWYIDDTSRDTAKVEGHLRSHAQICHPPAIKVHR